MNTLTNSLYEHVARLTPAQRAELVMRLSARQPGTIAGTHIPKRSDGAVALSPSQRDIWLVHSLDPESPTFNMPMRLGLRGTLDTRALRQAISEIVRRHEILRTTYDLQGDEPEQVVHDGGAEIGFLDLTNLNAAERARRVEKIWSDEVTRPFDLTRDLPLRARLLQLGPGDHVLLLNTHHIACDGSSIAIFARELESLYATYARGMSPMLGELPIQYGDYATWVAARSREPNADSVQYWRQHLGGAQFSEPLQLTPSSAEPRGATARPSAIAAFEWRPESAGRRPATTTFAWAVAAFQVLLHCLSGQRTIIVGTDVSLRDRLELEPLIGCLVTQVVLRTELTGDPSFAELVQRAQRDVDAAMAHKDVSAEHVIRAAGTSRRPGAQLFQAKIVGHPWLGAATPAEWRLDGLEVEASIAYPHTTQCDLTLFVRNGPPGISGTFTYDASRFDAARRVGLRDGFETLLRHVEAEDGLRLSQLRAVVSWRKEGPVMSTQPSLSGRSLRSLTPAPVETVTADVSQTLPFGDGLLVVEGAGDVPVQDWAATHAATLETELRTRGAVLFRGVSLDAPENLESFARLFCSELFDENGEHPRADASAAVYSPVFFPPEEKLLWHHENSFNRTWPMTIWFGCVQPADSGGETPIVDSRKVFAQLDPRIRDRFLAKGVMYVRNYQAGIGLDWQRVFQASSPAEVERRCRADGIEFEWRSDGLLRTRCVRPAAARHPATGAMSWFNQAQHWHPSCLDPVTRESLLELFAEPDLPRNCYYGDGSVIEDSVMAEILALYAELEIAFPWRASDVLMVDNMAMAHARNPFHGRRKLLVAMGHMTSWDQL